MELGVVATGSAMGSLLRVQVEHQVLFLEWVPLMWLKDNSSLMMMLSLQFCSSVYVFNKTVMVYPRIICLLLELA